MPGGQEFKGTSKEAKESDDPSPISIEPPEQSVRAFF